MRVSSVIGGVLLSMGLVYSSAFSAVDPLKPHPKVGSWLWKKMLVSERTSLRAEGNGAIVYLQENADLSDISDKLEKNEKGRLVHARLIQKALESQASLRAFLIEKNIAFTPHWITNMIVIESADAETLVTIADRPDVRRVVGDPNFKNVEQKAPALEFKAPKGVGQNISYIGADRVWNELGATGQGIVIAGQDTGVEWTHPSLKSKYRGMQADGTVNHDYNWYDAIQKPVIGSSKCGYATTEPCDDGVHGTHTMGTMLGDDGEGNQIGVAPGATWIACRNMDDGIGRPSSYISCFEFFMAPWKQGGDRFKDGDPTKAAHVINNSWGCPASEGCDGGEFVDVLVALEKAGILVVVSAGNEGPTCSSIGDGPAFNTEHVLSVGAMDSRTGRIASFSSRGPSTFDNKLGPDVAAPGVNVRSATSNGSYSGFQWSGTSMAGPHVAGLVALMWSAGPQLVGDVFATRDLIKSTALAKKQPDQTCGGVSGNTVPNNTWGFGAIDGFKAVTQAKSASR